VEFGTEEHYWYLADGSVPVANLRSDADVVVLSVAYLTTTLSTALLTKVGRGRRCWRHAVR